jgi:hypothetical protein
MKATEALSQLNCVVKGFRNTPNEKRVPDEMAMIAIEHARIIYPWDNRGRFPMTTCPFFPHPGSKPLAQSTHVNSLYGKRRTPSSRNASSVL